MSSQKPAVHQLELLFILSHPISRTLDLISVLLRIEINIVL